MDNDENNTNKARESALRRVPRPLTERASLASNPRPPQQTTIPSHRYNTSLRCPQATGETTERGVGEEESGEEEEESEEESGEEERGEAKGERERFRAGEAERIRSGECRSADQRTTAATTGLGPNRAGTFACTTTTTTPSLPPPPPPPPPPLPRPQHISSLPLTPPRPGLVNEVHSSSSSVLLTGATSQHHTDRSPIPPPPGTCLLSLPKKNKPRTVPSHSPESDRADSSSAHLNDHGGSAEIVIRVCDHDSSEIDSRLGLDLDLHPHHPHPHHLQNGKTGTGDDCIKDGDRSSGDEGSSGGCLRVPEIYGASSAANSSRSSFAGSLLSSPFRRLESRRGSSVTFILPAYVDSRESCSSSRASSPRHSACADREVLEQHTRRYALSPRRMSAPELPPLGDRERPSSRSTSKSCYSQLTPTTSTTPNPTPNPTTTTHNHNHNHHHHHHHNKPAARLPYGQGCLSRHGSSDASFQGLATRSQAPTTRSSGSLSSLPSGGKDGDGREGLSAGRGDRGCCLLAARARRHRRSSSRALSWSTAEHSNGSALKLETLFEQKKKQKQQGMSHSSSINNLTVPEVGRGGGGSGSGSVGDGSGARANECDSALLLLLPPRSCSVNGLRPCEAEVLARVRARKKGLSDCGARGGGGEMTVEETVLGTVEQFARLKEDEGVGGMRRASSENKLAERRSGPKARATSSRQHVISVNRTEKLVLRKPSARLTSTNNNNNNANNNNNKNVSRTRSSRKLGASPHVLSQRHKNHRLRYNRRQREGGDSEEEEEEGEEDDSEEEEEERRERIRAWLMGLDCADVPPEPVIEYADDPPQTDTALHIVYQDD